MQKTYLLFLEGNEKPYSSFTYNYNSTVSANALQTIDDIVMDADKLHTYIESKGVNLPTLHFEEANELTELPEVSHHKDIPVQCNMNGEAIDLTISFKCHAHHSLATCFPPVHEAIVEGYIYDCYYGFDADASNTAHNCVFDYTC